MLKFFTLLSKPFSFLVDLFFNPLRNVRGIDGEKIIVSKERPVYILALRTPDKKGGYFSQRIGTQSYDTLRNFVIKKLSDSSIYYIAKRRGRRMKDIKAIAVFNEQMGEVVCKRELVLKRILSI